MTAYQVEQHTQSLEGMVRETGYNIASFKRPGDKGYNYSRAMCLYTEACEVYRVWCGIHKAAQRAEDFIKRTYRAGPYCAI